MAPIRSLFLITLLAASAVSAIPQPTPTDTTALSQASPVHSPSSTTSNAGSEPTVRTDGKGYYDSETSYDLVDPMTAGADLEEDGTNKGNGGESKGSFMSMGVGAQIGIIVAVVVAALSMFGGAVWYYLHRRKVWEKEMIRRSTILQSKADMPIPPTPAGMPSNKEVRTDPATGKKFVTLKGNLPPQTPTWKRWMTQDV